MGGFAGAAGGGGLDGGTDVVADGASDVVADGGRDVAADVATDSGAGETRGDAGGIVIAPCTGPGGLCTDFSVAPLVEPGVATNICAAPSGPGPCILEPQDGSLFPGNWLRPRVSVQGISGPMKIVIHADREANDLVAYAASNTWTMPRDIWAGLAAHVQGADITVTVCGASGGLSTTRFTIAPTGAAGSIVFLAADPVRADFDPHTCQPPNPITACLETTQLAGFSVGDETTQPVLGIGQVAQQSRTDSANPSPVTCIGCHSATPDSGYVTFTDSYPWRAATASVQGAAPASSPSGTSFPTVTPGGLAALQQPGWGPFSFSLNPSAATNPVWQPGRRIGIGSLGLRDPLTPDYGNAPDQNDSPHLAWINLEAPNAHPPLPGDQLNWAYATYAPGAGIDSGNALGFIQHTGDLCGGVPCGAGMPSWSHDGSKIVYVSTNAALGGRFNQELPNPSPSTGAMTATSNVLRVPGMTNLFSVPFNGGLGGAATPIAGAATPESEEFYPALSPDDTYVAFTRVPAGQPMYANPNAELYVVPTAGGTASRLLANDPPACSGKTSPGINNHWPRWSPAATSGPGGSTYYWIVFSSNRAAIPPATSNTGRTIKISQLYLAPVVIDANDNVTTYPAVYLWNQPTTTVNTIPEWATFDVRK